jgi:hypothetical protein
VLDAALGVNYFSDMSDKTRPGTSRDERLKQALKANIARRKAQAKARARDDEADSGGETEESGDG